MVNNEEGLEKIFKQCKDLEDGEIDFATFIDNCEKILFNNVSSSTLEYFTDGWKAGVASNIIKTALKAYNGDENAMKRLRADFGIDNFNIEIKEL